MKQVCHWVLALGLLAGSFSTMPAAARLAAADRDSQSRPSPAVPADLKPLLAAPASEMRLVVTRYQADRNTVAGNYAGPSGAGRGGGRGGRGATPAVPP